MEIYDPINPMSLGLENGGLFSVRPEIGNVFESSSGWTGSHENNPYDSLGPFSAPAPPATSPGPPFVIPRDPAGTPTSLEDVVPAKKLMLEKNPNEHVLVTPTTSLVSGISHQKHDEPKLIFNHEIHPHSAKWASHEHSELQLDQAATRSAENQAGSQPRDPLMNALEAQFCVQETKFCDSTDYPVAAQLTELPVTATSCSGVDPDGISTACDISPPNSVPAGFQYSRDVVALRKRSTTVPGADRKSDKWILDELWPDRKSGEKDADASIVDILLQLEDVRKQQGTCQQNATNSLQSRSSSHSQGRYNCASKPLLTSTEVSAQAAQLQISTNPRYWSSSNLRVWLWHILRGENATLCGPVWEMTGAQLCALSREAFSALSPTYGDYIYTVLQAWVEDYDRSTEKIAVDAGCERKHSPLISQDASNMFPGYQPQRRLPCIQLWQFITMLLEDDRYYAVIRWIDRGEGIFKVEDSKALASLWGTRKGKDEMNYDKLSRSLRQYYLKKILKKTARPQRLIYQFIKPYPHLRKHPMFESPALPSLPNLW